MSSVNNFYLNLMNLASLWSLTVYLTRLLFAQLWINYVYTSGETTFQISLYKLLLKVVFGTNIVNDNSLSTNN